LAGEDSGEIAKWTLLPDGRIVCQTDSQKFVGRQKVVAGKRPKVAEKSLKNLSWKLTQKIPHFMQFCRTSIFRHLITSG
jgi:hypothetical protein